MSQLPAWEALAQSTLLGGPQRAPDPAGAAALYLHAANTGDVNAMLRSAVFAAEGFGRASDWEEALAWMIRAASAGAKSAQRQLALLAGAPDGPHDWRSLAREIDVAALLTPPPMQRVSDKSMVGVVRGYAPQGFSEWLIEHAQTRLTPSTVTVVATGEIKQSEARTAMSAPFGPLTNDLICVVLQERAARTCGVPVVQHEEPNALSYEVGQHYEAHYDFLPPKLLETMPEYAMLGQRIATVVTYLNDDYVGAATRFPRLNFEFRGQTGDALAFANVFADGTPDKNTLHAGLPPESGRKWVLSQWMRSKPQPFR